MKRELCLLLIFYILSLSITGQISYGGKPLPLSADASTRLLSATQELFVDMPKFDDQAALWRSQQDKSEFKSLEFAHKFDVHLRPDNSGITFNYGNAKIWRIGIRSRGAYSLNILFSKFRLPEGAKVFVYNSDQTEILGSYTSENNSDLNLLPIQPIGGDEVIVEYHLPSDIVDAGELEIGEVNHDFVGIFRATEPRDPVQSCHPNLICYPEDIEPGSGVVALIINGTTYCTGSLVNNSSEDGTPYLLTATHCLNNDYDSRFLNNRRYNMVAGNIVAFFNYNSPVCSPDIRGPLQMTLASTDSVLISERHDISLLKFKQNPPKEYHPYYLGWNVSSALSPPFHGIHHPNGGVKKVAIEEDNLGIGSFDYPKYNMEPASFWVVRDWEIAATEGGSSGSPLLDREKRIVGSLTGGESFCSSTRGPDIYASLNKFWDVEGSLENANPIKFYLDPEDTGTLQLKGLNPYSGEAFTKSHNYKIEEKPTESYFNSIPMFATNNTYGYSEYAEEFYSKNNVQIHGVFVSSPSINNIDGMQIQIRVYSGEKGPESLIYELPYNYSYRYYSGFGFNYGNRDMKHNIENYIEFENPITLSGSFYVSYSERNGIPNGFSALNTNPRKLGSGIESTAWMKGPQGWVRSSENIENPINTSLFIAAYGIGDVTVKDDQGAKKTTISVYYSSEVKRIFIESEDELLEWELYYVSGQKLYQERADKSINRASISAVHMPKGVYIVRVRTANGTISRNKVLLY
ncbi:MAG: T9SS type A sorting domain-containing protein [Bacteroidales bacterium]|nr:T9SS type A sorting domain-containing protein [Bacteroidales bacterium]